MTTQTDLQGLFSQNVIRTPDGRYFLPFKNTVGGQAQSGYSTILNENGFPVVSDTPLYGGGYNEATQNYEPGYSNYTDYFNAYDPNSVAIRGSGYVIGPQTSNALTRGTYGPDLGYYIDPNQFVGAQPPDVGGKPNDNGTWQILSLMGGPIASSYFTGVGLAGAGAGGTGSSEAVDYGAGESGIYGTQDAAAQANIGDYARYEDTTLTGNAGNTLQTDGGMNYEFDPYTGEQVGYSGSFQGGSGDFFDPSASNWTADDLWKALNSPVGQRLVGAGLGGLLGSVNRAKQAGTTTTTTSNLADWQRPYVEAALQDASRIYDTVPGGVDPLTVAGRNYFGDVIAGNYLKNPYEQAAADAVANDAANAVASKFSLAGRYGSPVMGENLARGVATAVAPYRYNTYNQERARQQAAASLAPDYSQAYLTQPFLKPSAYLGLVGKGYGRTVTEPYFENRTGSILGGALLGSQIFK